ERSYIHGRFFAGQQDVGLGYGRWDGLSLGGGCCPSSPPPRRTHVVRLGSHLFARWQDARLGEFRHYGAALGRDRLDGKTSTSQAAFGREIEPPLGRSR